MTPTWTPLCLVAACDLERAAWPMPVVALRDDLTAAEGPWPELLPRITLAASLSEEGAALISRLPGLEVPHVRLDRDPSALARALTQALGEAQARIARQLREISQLRQMSERMLRDFERLEAFAWASGRGERLLTQDLAPVGQTPLTFAEQRLPGDSAGLSDVAVWTTGGTGRLTATLTLTESAEVVGLWQVEDPTPGWLRMALPRALRSDPQTPHLRLDWEGAPLSLGRSLDHPDARFQCGGGPMLALRLWKFIPGSAAPLAPEAWAPEALRRRWLIGPAALAALSPEGFEPLEGAGLCARLTSPLALRLPGALRPGMAQVLAFLAVEGAPVAAAFDGGPVVTIEDSAQVPLFATTTVPQDLVLTLTPQGPATVTLDRIEAFAQASGRDD